MNLASVSLIRPQEGGGQRKGLIEWLAINLIQLVNQQTSGQDSLSGRQEI